MPRFFETPMRRLFPLATLYAAMALTVTALGGCASHEYKPSLANLPVVDTDWNADDYKYRIGPGDELGLRLVLSPDLNSQVTVGSDGRGVFPLVGPIKLAGLTVEEADALLTTTYGTYLRNPKAEMLIYNYAAGFVFVGGEVKQPGARQVRGTMTVSQAITDAGGFQDTSGMSKVVVLRHRRDGHVVMRVVNVSKLLAGKTDEDLRVLPGDLVFVPRSGVTEFDRIIRQYITQALPFTINYSLNPQQNLIPSP